MAWTLEDFDRLTSLPLPERGGAFPVRKDGKYVFGLTEKSAKYNLEEGFIPDTPGWYWWKAHHGCFGAQKHIDHGLQGPFDSFEAAEAAADVH